MIQRPLPLILASGSTTRAALLRSAGLAFTPASPGVDESALKQEALALGCSPSHIALALAQAKSLAILAPGALVLGADQVLDLDGQILSKPGSLVGAHAQLCTLSGRTHRLLSAISLAQDGAVLWHHTGVAQMTMRVLGEAEIARYIASAGAGILQSVGAYHYEGLGVHLFSTVEGDHSTILGLPLLPLLGFLRSQGISFQ